MATRIEIELFRSYGTHAIKTLTLSQHELRITIAPWDNLENELFASFDSFQLRSFEFDYDENEEIELPWDIVAIDSEKDEQLWQFCIRCWHVEIVFRANWPTMET